MSLAADEDPESDGACSQRLRACGCEVGMGAGPAEALSSLRQMPPELPAQDMNRHGAVPRVTVDMVDTHSAGGLPGSGVNAPPGRGPWC
jgi:hypothetical protein